MVLSMYSQLGNARVIDESFFCQLQFFFVNRLITMEIGQRHECYVEGKSNLHIICLDLCEHFHQG